MAVIVGGNSCTRGRQANKGCVRACALTFAGLRVGFEDEPFGAGAGVGARSVPAQAVVTEQTVHQALVDVCREASGGAGKKTPTSPGRLPSSFPTDSPTQFLPLVSDS